MNHHEEAARAKKADALVAFLEEVHAALPPRLPIRAWAAAPHFPWPAMCAAAGVKPASPKTRELVLEKLGAGAR